MTQEPKSDLEVYTRELSSKDSQFLVLAVGFQKISRVSHKSNRIARDCYRLDIFIFLLPLLKIEELLRGRGYETQFNLEFKIGN